MRCSAAIVGRLGRAAGTHRGDDLHHSPRVIECDDDIGEHEDHVGNVYLVVRRGAAPSRTHTRPRSRRNPTAPPTKGGSPGTRATLPAASSTPHDIERVVGALACDAAVLDDDLVAACADDLAVPDAEEAVAAEPLAADDALQQKRVLGVLGQRHEREIGVARSA